MTSDLKCRLRPRITKEDLVLIGRAAKIGGETPSSFVRRWGLTGARIELQKIIKIPEESE